MFKKIVTTIQHNGDVSGSIHGTNIGAGQVEADMAQTRRAIRQDTESKGRVVHVEQTMTSLVVVYASGAVRVTQWVAASS